MGGDSYNLGVGIDQKVIFNKVDSVLTSKGIKVWDTSSLPFLSETINKILQQSSRFLARIT